MSGIESLTNYAEEVGGIFRFDDMQVVPYNHWRKDCEWIVLIIEGPSESAAVIPVKALTAKEACSLAINLYTNIYNGEDDVV